MDEHMAENGRRETVAAWLYGGQFHCDAHRGVGIPYFFAPLDAKCAECSNDAPESYLNRSRFDRRATDAEVGT